MNTVIKIKLITIFAMIFLFSAGVSANTPTGNEVFGIGVQLGDPTAITAKLLPSEYFGFQAYVGGGAWHNDYYHAMFMTGLDVIFHPFTFHEWKTCALNLTLGAGAALGLFRGWYHDNWTGNYYYDQYYYDGQMYGTMFIRFVTGASLWFKKFPLETFAEITPAIQLFRPYPIDFHMFWTVGARWWF
ncbi:MAG: hypothetical protein JXR91_02365 [Deltaproteobacteria bacterium]|nr:hypothetical protein [Deltaproteobacteria bacterium]